MRQPVAIATALVLLLAGCGETDDSTPVACLEGPAVYLGALEEAPGQVELDGEVPISDCLTENQGGGDLATVGAAMVEAAAELNTEARGKPGGEANLELGYLVGAAREGATGTGGIHADLIRRLETAARYSPEGRPLPEGFEAAYARGFEAGEADG